MSESLPGIPVLRRQMFALLVVLCLTFGQVNALRSPSRGRSVAMSSSVFTQTKSRDRSTLKLQILQLGAALDRGQAYNPTSGSYYEDRMEAARERVQALVKLGSPTRTLTLAQLDGEWELVFSTVKNGIFRSSPFFLAIQEAFARGGEPDKANLFFKVAPPPPTPSIWGVHFSPSLCTPSFTSSRCSAGASVKSAGWHRQSTPRRVC